MRSDEAPKLDIDYTPDDHMDQFEFLISNADEDHRLVTKPISDLRPLVLDHMRRRDPYCPTDT